MRKPTIHSVNVNPQRRSLIATICTIIIGVAIYNIVSYIRWCNHLLKLEAKRVQSIPSLCINHSNETGVRLIHENGNRRRSKDKSSDISITNQAVATFVASKDFIPALEVYLYSYSQSGNNHQLLFAVPVMSCLDEYIAESSVLAISLVRQQEEELVKTIQSLMTKYPHIAYKIYAWPILQSPKWTNPRWRINYTKLRLWEMIEYERILYVDLDVIFLDSIASVFNSSLSHGFLGTYDYGKHSNISSKKMNGGVFLLQPSQDIYRSLIRSMNDESGQYIVFEAEQGLINYFFNHSSHCCLSYTYNTQKTVSKYLSQLWDVSNIKIIHYVGEKPWRYWSPTHQRDKYLSKKRIMQLKRTDTWDAHEFEWLHQLWKMLYLSSRRHELDIMRLYLIDEPFEYTMANMDSDQMNARFMNISKDWKLSLAAAFHDIHYLSSDHDVNRSSSVNSPFHGSDTMQRFTFDIPVDSNISMILSLLKMNESLPTWSNREVTKLSKQIKIMPNIGSLGMNQELSSHQYSSPESSDHRGLSHGSKKSNHAISKAHKQSHHSNPSKEHRKRLSHGNHSQLTHHSDIQQSSVDDKKERNIMRLSRPDYLAIVDMKDILHERSLSIDWTKITSLSSRYGRHNHSQSSSIHNNTVFYWNQRCFQNYYKEMFLHHHSNQNTRSHSISMTDSSSTIFWNSFESHIRFPLPHMNGNISHTIGSFRRKDVDAICFPEKISSIILPSALFELFIHDLADVVLSIGSCYRSQNKSAITPETPIDTRGGLISSHSKEVSRDTVGHCLCINPSDASSEELLYHLYRPFIILHLISDNSNGKISDISKIFNNLDAINRHRRISSRHIGAANCFNHIYKIYWHLWLKQHHVNLIHAVDQFAAGVDS